MRLIPLQYIFERIALTRRDLTSYLSFRKRREHYITDQMENLDDKQRRRRRLLEGGEGEHEGGEL